MAFIQRSAFWIVLLTCVCVCSGQAGIILRRDNVCKICGYDGTFGGQNTCTEYKDDGKKLHCNNVNITDIDDLTFSKESNLVLFELQNTALVGIGDEAFCGTRIVYLYLEKNKLRTIPNTTCISETLKEMYLQGNRINHINNSLGFLTALKILDISDNGLAYAPYNALCGTSLTRLTLSGNRLTSTMNFSCIHDISIVEMNKNDIQIVPEHSFENVRFDQLSMEYNQLSNVTVLTNISQTTGRLDLKGNNFTCFNAVSLCYITLSLSGLTAQSRPKRDLACHVIPNGGFFK